MLMLDNAPVGVSRVGALITFGSGTGFPLSRSARAAYSPPMDGIVLALLLAAMAATVGALLLGLFSMARGGEFDKRNANRFMRLRVACQGLAILLFLIFMMVWHRS